MADLVLDESLFLVLCLISFSNGSLSSGFSGSGFSVFLAYGSDDIMYQLVFELMYQLVFEPI